MPSTSDIRACSKDLLRNLQQLDVLLDRVAGTSEGPAEAEDIARESQGISNALARTRSSLLAAAGDGPTATLDAAEARRSLAVSLAELPLEPALLVLGEVPRLAEEVEARTSGNAVLLVPLCLAYRHCVEALMPLATAVDPRDVR